MGAPHLCPEADMISYHELTWLYNGHESIFYDPNKGKELEEARDKFAKLIKDKWSAFGYKKVGDKVAKAITEFSPDFARIIMVPPTSGGTECDLCGANLSKWKQFIIGMRIFCALRWEYGTVK